MTTPITLTLTTAFGDQPGVGAVVEEEGGTLVTLAGTFPVTAFAYGGFYFFADFTKNPIAYSGVVGVGNRLIVDRSKTPNEVRFASPAVPPIPASPTPEGDWTGVAVFLVADDATVYVSDATVSVVRRAFHLKRYTFRQRFSPKLRTGPTRFAFEPPT